MKLKGAGMKRDLLYALVASLLVVGGAPRLLAQEGSTTGVDEYTVPEGTEFKLQLHTAVNSKTSKTGDRVIATLIDPVAVEDRDVLPKGVRIDGHVNEVKPAGRRGKGGYLYILFDTVELPNGEKVAISGSLTEIFSSEGGADSSVGVEGELKGHGASRKSQLVIVGGSTAAGVAGGVGPGIAAGVGGLVAALVLPKGKEATLLAGSLVGMRLDRDVTIAMPSSGK